MSQEPKPRTYGYWENMNHLIHRSEAEMSELEFMWGMRHANYPTRTAQDLEIADLKRENNAAFQRIQELSAALFDLGYDPTAKNYLATRSDKP